MDISRFLQEPSCLAKLVFWKIFRNFLSSWGDPSSLFRTYFSKTKKDNNKQGFNFSSFNFEPFIQNIILKINDKDLKNIFKFLYFLNEMGLNDLGPSFDFQLSGTLS